MSEHVYFAADKPENTVAYLEEKAKEWFTGITDTSYLDKIKASWRSYYGDFYGRDGNSSHSISFGGENGELVNLAVNHYRNLAQHILVMVTGTRPSFQCRAMNTDNKSIIQAKLGNGLLDYYMREMRLEEILKDAVEYAIILGSGYVKLEWNSTKGEVIDYIEPDPESIVGEDDDGMPIDANGNIVEALPINEGEVEASLLSPFDVVFDSTKEYFDKNEWVVCRTAINRHVLIAKYPEYADQIMAIESKSSEGKKHNTVPYTKYDETNDIHVYELFHKKNEAVPNGRYMLYINKEIVLEDTILPYRKLPVYRIVPSSIIGTPYGYSNMFDLLPIQDMINSLYSTAATNINAFGVQSILSPRGADVEAEQVGDGMQFIEYNAQVGKPEPLQLTATSPEVYQMMSLLEKTMETLSGVNSVARGNPEQSLRSGNALALVQSQALQYVSGLQKSYIRLLEDVGTGLIHLLQDFASSPRMVAIAGMNNITEMKEFKSDDIMSISRVAVNVGNALMQTSAGRAQVAENLMQMGLIDNVDKYLMVLNSGNLDALTDSKFDNMTLIKAENEAMMLGEAQQAIWSERHSIHIKEHMEVLNDPRLKQDPELVQRVLDHVTQHANLLRTVDPALLQAIGEQPLAPAPNPANMGGQQGGAPQPPQQGVPVDQTNAAMMNPQQPVDQGQLPQPAQPAGVEEGILPPQPTSPEDLL